MAPRLSPDKTAILTASDKHTIILWDANTENVIMKFNTGISSTLENYDDVSAEFLNNGSTIFCEIGYAITKLNMGTGYEKQVFWWDVSTGTIKKNFSFPYYQKMSDLPHVYSTKDCSRYLIHDYYYNLYNSSNDSLIGKTDKSGLLCFSSDLSIAIFNDGTQRNFLTNTESMWMDSSGAMKFDTAFCSPDNSKLLLLWKLTGGGPGFNSVAYVRVHNKNYRLSSMGADMIIAPTGNPFTDDGNKLALEYGQGKTNLFDLSVISGVVVSPESSMHGGNISLHSINHGELRFLIPQEYAKIPQEMILNIYVLSGAVAASFPMNRHTNIPLQSFKLPDRLSSGTYIYRFERCRTMSTGKFILIR
jgi:hypothetical protein